MSTFGIIFVGYNCEDLIHRSLTPWVEAKRCGLDGHTFKIVGVSVPFIGFEQPSEQDGTHSYFHHYLEWGIDHVILNHIPVKETDARGAALKWLVEQGVDFIWQVDSDEVFAKSDISNAARFVEDNPWVQWFRVSYKNFVFDEKHYLAEPFTPPRIHRVYAPKGYKTFGFYEDNNVLYSRPWMNNDPFIPDTAFSSMTIPLAVPHYSWVSNERSRLKEKYQRKRWNHCSFKWNDQSNSLEFDPAYFAARGLPLPEVITLDSSS